MEKEKRVKIGIITLSASDNCGSLLQTYALQTVVQNLGDFDVEIINFSTKESHDIYDIFNRSCLWNHKRLKYRLKYYKSFKKQKKAYKYFRSKYLNLSGRREIFPAKLKKKCYKYDIIIAGSDQIWNVKMTDYNNAFFVYWADCCKIAYAPSLGEHDLREADNYLEIVAWLKQFKAISVRENPGRKCLEELLGQNIQVVLDPTLLLSKDYWEKIAGNAYINEKYIFYYSWAYKNEDFHRIVQKESERTGYQVYVIDESKWTRKNYEKFGFKLASRVGPLGFLNLMKYAKMSFVESFHGTIFAYIFEINFWILDEKWNGKYDERIFDLVATLKINDRFLNVSNYDVVDMESAPDYKNTKLILSQMQNISLKYLKENLK